MKLTWYGHSCFLLETGDGSVVFDPYEPGSVPGSDLPALTADAVLCSHDHSDHNYAAGVTLTRRTPSFTVEILDCFHDEARGSLRGTNKIHVVNADGLRIAHLGDLGHMLSDEQFAKLGKIDVLLIPVGGYFTIDATAARKIADRIQPAVVIPMHYRGEGYGYEVIDTVLPFLSLSDHVRKAASNTVVLPYAESGVTLLLQHP